TRGQNRTAKEPSSAAQSRLGVVDHRPPRRLGRLSLLKATRSNHLPEWPRVLPCYRHGLDAQKCVHALAPSRGRLRFSLSIRRRRGCRRSLVSARPQNRSRKGVAEGCPLCNTLRRLKGVSPATPLRAIIRLTAVTEGVGDVLFAARQRPVPRLGA